MVSQLQQLFSSRTLLETPPNLDPLPRIPVELLENIVLRVDDVSTLYALCLTCKHFHALIYPHRLWRNLNVSTYHPVPPRPEPRRSFFQPRRPDLCVACPATHWRDRLEERPQYPPPEGFHHNSKRRKRLLGRMRLSPHLHHVYSLKAVRYGAADAGTFDAALDLIQSLSNLESLTLTNVLFNQTHLWVLRELPHLRSLSLDGCTGLQDPHSIAPRDKLSLARLHVRAQSDSVEWLASYWIALPDLDVTEEIAIHDSGHAPFVSGCQDFVLPAPALRKLTIPHTILMERSIRGLLLRAPALRELVVSAEGYWEGFQPRATLLRGGIQFPQLETLVAPHSVFDEYRAHPMLPALRTAYIWEGWAGAVHVPWTNKALRMNAPWVRELRFDMYAIADERSFSAITELLNLDSLYIWVLQAKPAFTSRRALVGAIARLQFSRGPKEFTFVCFDDPDRQGKPGPFAKHAYWRSIGEADMNLCECETPPISPSTHLDESADRAALDVWAEGVEQLYKARMRLGAFEWIYSRPDTSHLRCSSSPFHHEDYVMGLERSSWMSYCVERPSADGLPPLPQMFEYNPLGPDASGEGRRSRCG